MTESIYKEYENKYYNPTDNDKRPGDNDNWKSIQEGFHRIGSTQLETSEGLTLGKGTEDETSVTAAELARMKQGGEEYLPYFVGTLGLSGTLRANTVETFDASNPDTFKGIVNMLRAKGYSYVTLKAAITINNANPDTYSKMAILDVVVEDNNGVVSVNMFPLEVNDSYLINIRHLGVRCFNFSNTDITLGGAVWFFVYPNKYIA